MDVLNFPNYRFRFKNNENIRQIFDPIRKKFVILTPEEWVRQHTISFLMNEKQMPSTLMAVERRLMINGVAKRYDIVVHNPNGSILLLVECKAPQVKIDQKAFDQIARYNLSLKAQLLMVTNGLNHYFCTMDYANETYRFLRTLPSYSSSENNP